MGCTIDPTEPKRLALITQQDPYKDYCESTGVWVSADDGKTWTQTSDGLGELRGSTLAFDPFHPSRLVCGTEGRGFFVTDWPKTFVPTGGKSYAATADDTKFAAVRGEDAP